LGKVVFGATAAPAGAAESPAARTATATPLLIAMRIIAPTLVRPDGTCSQVSGGGETILARGGSTGTAPTQAVTITETLPLKSSHPFVSLAADSMKRHCAFYTLDYRGNLFDITEGGTMQGDETERERPIEFVAREEAVVLVRSLLVDWSVFDHLHQHGILEERYSLRAQDGCCKPDGGTCCVNKGARLAPEESL
jgi:hypothetical protein